MSHTLHLAGINIDGVGGFVSGQTLSPGPGLTIIEGANGSGKTRLVHALKDHIRSTVPPTALLSREVALALIFLDQSNVTYPGQESLMAKGLFGSGQEAIQKARAVSEEATKLWQQGAEGYDFRCARHFINVSEDGLVSVRSIVGSEQVNEHYSSFSERVAIDLALRTGLQKVCGLTLPLVIDDIFNCLSTVSSHRLLKMLDGYPAQCIVMAHPANDLKADATRLALVPSAAGTLCLH